MAEPPALPPRVLLRGISARAWEHPSDRAALTALRGVPGFDLVVRKLFGLVGERPLRLAFLASSVRVTPRQFPRLHAQMLEVCRVLDAAWVPELYVAQTPFVNAGAIGVDRPFIVLNSGLLGLLEGEEVQFVLGHELGHVLSGHALYKTMLRLLLRLSSVAFSIPLGGAAVFAVTAALLEWDRCSELSADRAGLLAVQSPEAAQRTIMKMAGGTQTGEMSLAEFQAQADEYRTGGSVVDSVMKVLSLLGQSHPFPVLRLAELRAWVKSGGDAGVVAGRYPCRADDPRASTATDAREAARTWQQEFAASRDPLAQAVRSAGRKAQTLAAAFGRTVSDALRRDRPGARRQRPGRTGRPRG